MTRRPGSKIFLPLPLLGSLRCGMLWDDPFDRGLAVSSPSSVACKWKKSKYSKWQWFKGLSKEARWVSSRNPSFPEAQPSHYISHTPVIRRKTLYSLDQFFWGCHASSWDFSVLLTCLLEARPYYYLNRFALKSETEFGYTRNKVIFKVSKHERHYFVFLIVVAVHKWAWHFSPFPSHRIRSLRTDLPGLSGANNFCNLRFHQLIWGMHIPYFNL